MQCSSKFFFVKLNEMEYENNKWIFTSFVLAFIAIPIMTHLVALVVLMLLGLTEFICDSLNYPLGTLGQNLQLYGGLSPGAPAMFIEGAVWGNGVPCRNLTPLYVIA